MPRNRRRATPPSRRSKKSARSASVNDLAAALAKAQVATPFADVGGQVGGLFGPVGKTVGKWLGSGIGQIFGSGGYRVQGTDPKYNVLYNSDSIPQFGTARGANVICHREYLTDISGQTAFSNVQYPINPGLVQTFPWLSCVAQNFEEYRIHGLIFEFRSTSTEYASTGVLGAVIFATQYNVHDKAFTTKVSMESYEYAQSCKPSTSMIHGVECARTSGLTENLLIRSGSASGEQQLYDLGVFNVAVAGMASSYVAGELWVSYCIELLKPKIPDTIGGTQQSYHAYCTGATSALPVGAISAKFSGNLINAGIANGNAVVWSAMPGTKWLVAFTWTFNAGTFVFPTPVLTNLTALDLWYNDTQNLAVAPFGGTDNTQQGAMFGVYQSTNTIFTGLAVALNAAGTLPANANCDVFVTCVDTTITA